MERCPKCGNKLSNIDVLCPRCGALVEVVQVKNSYVPPVSPEDSSQKGERPSLVVYDDDFPGDKPLENQTDEQTVPDNEPQPEGNELQPEEVPPLQAVPEPQPAQPLIPGPLYETPKAFQKEEQADSRMARRARQRQQQEPSGHKAGSSTPEDKLLKEADELTSRAALRARIKADSSSDWRTRAEADTADSISPRSDADVSDSFSSRSEANASDAFTSPYSSPAYGMAADSEPSEALEDGNDTVTSSGQEEPVHRYRAEYRASLTASQNKDRRKLPVPAAILLWVMVAAVLFLGFFYLNGYVQKSYGGYAAFIRQMTGGKLDLGTGGADSQAITVTPVASKTANGEPAHTFDVTAAGATSVRVLPTGDVYSMTDGKATFTIPDEAIARALGVVSYDNSTVAQGLNLDVTFGAATSNYSIDPFNISLIGSEYKRESPQQTKTSLTSDAVSISLVVAPKAKVYINNVNYTNEISGDGKLDIDMPLETSGDNIFAVDVIQSGRQAIKDSFTVTRQTDQTLLKPEADYIRVYTDSFECRGTTDAGATLSAQLNGKTFTGLVSGSGAYSAACTATQYGLYSVTLKASSDGKTDNEVTISVERLPDSDTFQKSAKKQTAAEVVKNAVTLSDVGIQLTGKIGDVTTEGLAQKFTIGSGSSQLSCYFYGQTPQLSANKEYTLYGMVDEAGSFYVMFIK